MKKLVANSKQRDTINTKKDSSELWPRVKLDFIVNKIIKRIISEYNDFLFCLY